MKFLKNLVLLCLLGFLFHVSKSTNKKNWKKVHLRYKSQWHTDHHMPDRINVTLTGMGIAVKLYLSRFTHADQDLQVYTLGINDSGMLVHTKQEVASSHSVAYYQDLDNEAIICATKHDILPSGWHLKFKGQFVLNGIKFTIDSESPQKRERVSSLDGYVLRQELDVQHDIIALMRDTGKLFRLKRHLGNTPTATSTGNSPGLHSRKQREALPSYYVDIVAVIDHKAYLRFHHEAGNKSLALLNLREYYAFIINGVDLLYQSLRNVNFKIHVRLIKIVVAETAESSSFTEQFRVLDYPVHTVEDDLVLTALKEYVKGSGRDVVTPSDHVMLFTGYDVVRRIQGSVTKKSAGRAYQGTLCQDDGYSTSLIEDIQGFGSISIAAHELGHSLSANHDGEGNECSSSDRYIMSAVMLPSTPTTKLNPWRFSECSERSFSKFVTSLLDTSLGSKCLKESLPAEENVAVPGLDLPGLKYSADHQCRLIHGNESFLCSRIDPYDLFIDPSNICTQMYCYDPIEESCYSAVAVQGTVCGSGKLCILGECVPHESAPKLNESCMFGDDPMAKINRMNCSELISQHPYFCYDAEIGISCCASCQAIYRQKEGCEYGDHSSGCSESNCGEGAPRRHACCGTCSRLDAVTSTLSADSQNGVCVDKPKVSINGMPCREAIQATPALCYIRNVEKECCESCGVVHSPVAGCEYGDHVSGCVDAHCYEDSPTLDGCCGTCNYSVPDTGKEVETVRKSTPKTSDVSDASSGSTSMAEPSSATGTPSDALSDSNEKVSGFLSTLETTKDSRESTVVSSGSTEPMITTSGLKDPNLSILNATRSRENIIIPNTTHSTGTTTQTTSSAPTLQTTPFVTPPATKTAQLAISTTRSSGVFTLAALTRSPQARVNQYVSQQQHHLQQLLEQQQLVLERLLHHDLMHQELTLHHHHQAHLKLLLKHYLYHQKNLLENHLHQQRALLQEHLRKQTNHLETLCHN